MGRKASVDKVVLDAEIIRRKNEIVGIDNHSIPGTNDKVWKNIADAVNLKCQKNISAASVRLRIALNRDSIQNRLGLIPLKKKMNKCELKICDENPFISDSDESLSGLSNKTKEKCFTITFSVEDWKIIEPRSLEYMEKSGFRTYELLTPHVWTNIVQDHFFLHTRLPCALSFKKNRTSSSGKYFLTINGRCNECGSNFIGFIEEIPAHTRAIMRCTYSGDFHVIHTKKRRLIGLEKKRALEHMIDRKEAPSVYTTNEARRIMKSGDMVPAQMPSVGALRQAKSRALSLKRLHPDPINALFMMKLENRAIRDIGYDKFFVHFWSDIQLKIYKECTLKNKTPTISFDATGGCCRKLKRHNNDLSGHIFLYEGVMNINDQNFTALSMLSEQHDNVAISLWMKRWLRCNVPAPKVIISDQSLALMSAIVQSFTQYNTLEKYLNVCFSLLGKNEGEKPICFIRNDVNHFVHLLSKWQPLKINKYPRTKQLFTRAMCLLIFCKTLDEAKGILEAIFIIALSKYDGPCIHYDGEIRRETETACAQSKKFLQSLISNNADDLIQNINCHSLEEPIIEEIEIEHDNHNLDDLNICSFKYWAKQISLTCEFQVENIIGEFDNAQYIPELVPMIINTMKLFPCWSSIMVNVFGFGEEIGSSCRVESHFNNLKNRILKNEELPIRVDSLVEKITEHYAGDHLLLEAMNINESKADPLQAECVINSINILSSINEEVSEKNILKDNSKRTSHKENDLFFDEIPSKKSNELTKIFDCVQCIACENGDMPTGLHRCANCDKFVHLFGCSVTLANTEEGCGEKRVCLECDEIDKDILKESTAVENWKKKGSTLKNSKRLRSATSYLNKQPGFDKIDLNKKGKITPIAVLKNGSCFQNKPLSFLPGLDKVLLNNTCSADSILSVLAVCAEESNSYYHFLLEHKDQKNLTATFVLNMIGNKPSKDMYRARVYLLSMVCTLNTRLIGNITCIDTMDTALSMAEKLLDNMPSYNRTHRCSNPSCFEPEITNSGVVISFNAFDGKVDIQKKLAEYFQSKSRICVSLNCGHTRDEVIKPMEHIIVELVAIPQDFQSSTYGDTKAISEIKQNYAGKVLWKLDEIEKKIIINDDHYNLKGIIAFNASDWKLRQTHGHYIAYCLRLINDQWECYDDIKDAVTIKSKDHKVNVELLFYTKL